MTFWGVTQQKAACGVPEHVEQNHCCRLYIPLQNKSECCQEVSGIQVLLHNFPVLSACNERFDLQHTCIQLELCNASCRGRGLQKKLLLCLWYSSGFTGLD